MKLPHETTTDLDIVTAIADHPICGRMRFERTRQDRRIYYRLLMDDGTIKRTGMLTGPTTARETIEYWRSKGWL